MRPDADQERQWTEVYTLVTLPGENTAGHMGHSWESPGHHHAEQASPFMALSTGRKGGGRASRFGGGWFEESQQTLGQRGCPWLSDLTQGN